MGRCETESDAEPASRARSEARIEPAQLAPAPETDLRDFASREGRTLGPLDDRDPGGRS